MKKIGLVGGISWSSTIDYYRYLNEETNKILGGLHFPECIIYSLNFDDFRKHNAAREWEKTLGLLSNAVCHLKDAGADVIMLGANTAHIVAEQIQEKTGMPIIDIRVATANEINKRGLKKVALLGTTYTMELDFYKDKIAAYGIEVITPARKDDRDFIEETLVNELGKGVMVTATKKRYIKIANSLVDKGAQGIILGCTEIPLLLSQDDFSVPVFNTTRIHAKAAVQFALQTADYCIVNAVMEDLDTICRLFEEAILFQKMNNYIGWTHYDRAYLEADIQNGLLYKIVSNENITGIFSTCFSDELIWREKEKGDAVYLHRIVLNQQFKGEKLFKKIVHWAMELAEKRNLQNIRMDTWAANEKIISYYKSYGFEFIENYTTPGTTNLPIQHRNLEIALLELNIKKNK